MHRADLEYVGFWPRVGAAVIDALLLFLVTMLPLRAIYGPEYFEQNKFIAGPADFIISWVFPAVVVIWMWVKHGQTPGKMAIGANIVDAETGGPLTLEMAAIRYAGYFISFLGVLIGYLWVGFDPKKQGWHDHMAKTVVVRKKDRRPPDVRFGKS